MSIYTGISGKAKAITKAYVGVKTRLPVYETTGEKVTITVDNISEYFTVTNSTYYFSGSSGTWTSNNKAVGSSTAQTVLTLKSDGKVSFNYTCSSETNYDKLTITTTIGGTTTTRVNAVSGVKSGSLSYSMSAGDSITFKYTKDSSVNSNSDICTFSNLSHDTTQEVFVGYEEKDLAKKVWRAYVGVNGKAKLAYSSRAEVKFKETANIMPVNKYYSAKAYLTDYVLISGGAPVSTAWYNSTGTTYAIERDDLLVTSQCSSLSNTADEQWRTFFPDGSRAIFYGGSRGQETNKSWYQKRVDSYDNDLVKSSLADLTQGRSYSSGISSDTHSLIMGGLIGWSTSGTWTASVEGFVNETLTKVSSVSSLAVTSSNYPEAFQINGNIVAIQGTNVQKYDNDLTKTTLSSISDAAWRGIQQRCMEYGNYVSFLSKGNMYVYDEDLTYTVSKAMNTNLNKISFSADSTIYPVKGLYICSGYYIDAETEEKIYGYFVFEDGVTYSGFIRMEELTSAGYCLFKMSDSIIMGYDSTTTSIIIEVK